MEDTEGWYTYDSYQNERTDISSEELADPTKASTYLKLDKSFWDWRKYTEE
jgi:hypothetical protein